MKDLVIFVNGFAPVECNNKFGVININGDKICECVYDCIHVFYNGFATVECNNKYGYINEQGVEVVPCNFNWNGADLMLEKYKLNLFRIQKLKTII